MEILPSIIARSQIEKLPDKGERINNLFDRIGKELASRDEIDRAASMFSDLNIAEKGLKRITQMEWTGGRHQIAEETVVDDIDEGEHAMNPLKIIAQSRSNVKIVKVVPAVPSLITAADLAEIASFKQSSATGVNGNETSAISLEPHALHLCTFDRGADDGAKFMPHRTTKSDVHSVDKEKLRTKGKYWEVTAATHPTIRNTAVKLLSLQESIELEHKHQDELKQMKEGQAVERLEARKKLVSDNLSLLPPHSSSLDPNELFTNYRQPAEIPGHSDEENNSENSYDGEE